MTLRLLTAFAMLITNHAHADVSWYITGKTSIASQRLDNSSHGGTIGDGTVFANILDGTLAVTDLHDETAGIGFAIGRTKDRTRFELEMLYRYRTDWDLRSITHSIGEVTNIFSDISTTTLMLSAHRDIPISERWKWDVGAAIGLARNTVDAKYIERGVAGVRPEVSFSNEDSDTEFAWGVSTGITRQINGRWQVGVHYRYLDLGEVNAGPFSPRPARLSADHTAHELQLSIVRAL